MQYASGAQLNLQIVSNKVRMTSVSDTQDCIGRVNTIANSADHWAQFRIATTAGTTSRSAWVMVRHSLSGALVEGYVCMAKFNDGSSKTSRILKRVAGAGSELASTTAGSWAANDVVRGDVIGTQVTVNKNGVSFLTVADATFSTGAPSHLGISIAATGAVGDYEVDSFAAGIFVPEVIPFSFYKGRMVSSRRRPA